jgi:hypothetical protein
MITTAGLHAIVGLFGSTDTPVDFTYIAYGSGTTAAAASDTTLGTETQRALAAFKRKSVLKPDDTWTFTKHFVTTAAGSCTEIGLFTASSNGTMLLRTLPVSPTTYTAGETLTVTVDVTVKNYACGTGATW